MGVFDRQIATAKRLIAKNGRALVWRTILDGTPVDANKPWEPGAAQVTDYPDIRIVILPAGYKGETSLFRLTTGEQPSGTLQMLMGAVPFEPSTKDVIIDGEIEYRIDYIDKLAPNGDPILYTIVTKQ